MIKNTILKYLCHVRHKTGDISPHLWWMFCALCFVPCVLCLALCSAAYAFSPKLNNALEKMYNNEYYAAIDECDRQQRAASEFEKAEMVYIKGECLMELGNYQQARQVYKQALQHTNGYLENKIYNGIADSFFMQKRYDDAISVYKQLLEKSSADLKARLLFKLGKAFQRQSKWAMSDFYFERLKREYPQSLEAVLVDKQSVGGNFFTIQVGCFSDKNNAKKLKKDLESKGYDVYLTPFKDNDTILYRVRVGEFVSAIAAEHEEELLKEKEHLPTHIFP